jgi:hypothetical protein
MVVFTPVLEKRTSLADVHVYVFTKVPFLNVLTVLPSLVIARYSHTPAVTVAIVPDGISGPSSATTSDAFLKRNAELAP